MNDNMPQGEIDEFVGPGKGIRRRREIARSQVRCCIRSGSGTIKGAVIGETRKSTHQLWGQGCVTMRDGHYGGM